MATTIRKAKGSVDLLHGPIMKQLLLFMLPLFLSNAFQSLYNAVDTAIVGNFLGEHSLAAVGSCSSIFDLMVGFCNNLGVGFSLVVASYYGMGDENRLKKAVAGALKIGVCTTAVLTAAAFFGMRSLLGVINTPPDLMEEAYSYIHLLGMAVMVMFSYNFMAAMLRAIGNSVLPLLFLILSSVLNVGLDILFITRFHMGVRGAAAATVLAQGVSAVLCCLYILTKVHLLIPEKRHFAWDSLLMKALAGQGFSMAFMGSIVNIGTVTLQSGINSLGANIISGHVAARKVFSLFSLPLFSMSLALSTFVSQNYGAGKHERIRGCVKDAWIYCAVVCVIEVIILQLAATSLIRLVSGSSNPEILKNGTIYMQFASPFYCVLGVLISTRNALQGLQMKIIPLVSSVIELVGKILFTWLFVPRFGYAAVIVCEPIIWCFMCAQVLMAYRKKNAEIIRVSESNLRRKSI